MRPPLVEAMLDPGFYPHKPKGVRLIETHISWVFLTGSYAYKVKKPVNFGFLDFTTLKQRTHFAHEEVRLNRRLSPEIYLGVLEIRRRDGGFSLQGPGEVVEVAVWMKELREEWRLDLLLESGKVGHGLWDLIAERIARFHGEAETNPYIASFGEPEKVMVNVKENFDQTEPFRDITIPKGWFVDLRDYSFGFLTERRDLFKRRIQNGRIREGHGDLHTENIYYDGKQLHVLDCIEFNERFRFQDTASDVAFLLMDLEARGFEEGGWRFLNGYLQYSGDFELLQVLRFYKIYRAYVRGKIESFQMAQKGKAAEEKARGYFELAWRYLVEERPRFLLASCGVMGSGKSTLCMELASRLGAVLIRSDSVRKLSLGIPPWEHRYEPFGQGIYSPEVTDSVYKRMISLAEEVLGAGYPVILDGSFSKASHRRMVSELAQRLGIPYLFLYTQCPVEVIKERIGKRRDISDGRVEILEEHIRSFETPKELPPERVLSVDTRGPLSVEVIREVRKRVR